MNLVIESDGLTVWANDDATKAVTTYALPYPAQDTKAWESYRDAHRMYKIRVIALGATVQTVWVSEDA